MQGKWFWCYITGDAAWEAWLLKISAGCRPPANQPSYPNTKTKTKTEKRQRQLKLKGKERHRNQGKKGKKKEEEDKYNTNHFSQMKKNQKSGFSVSSWEIWGKYKTTPSQESKASCLSGVQNLIRN